MAGRTHALTLIFALTYLTISCLADDGAASISAGGIVMKRESRIAMQKEVLTIGVKKVKVDYEFRNDTDEDITTEIAFPIPPYKMDLDRYSFHQQGFGDFQLTVEGKRVHFDVEARARLEGKDVTNVLTKYGVDVATFGHLDEKRDQAKDIRRLTSAQRSFLVKAGLIDADTNMDWASWTVEKKYYWSQTFPAHTTIRISHSYSPVVGFGLVPTEDFRAAKPNLSQADRKNLSADQSGVDDVKSVCPSEQLRNNLERASAHDVDTQGYGYLEYVDFILTTANTWKQPIGDFTLFVERPDDGHRERYSVSFCWPGKVEQVGPNLFKATATNLVPKHELRVGFFGVNK
jgi:hypothetical protein